jgi:hypothetical protein
LGSEISKIESKQMRDICFLTFSDTVKMHYIATDDFCKVNTVFQYIFQSLGSVLFWSDCIIISSCAGLYIYIIISRYGVLPLYIMIILIFAGDLKIY